MQLRPYQIEAVEAVYNHLRIRDDNPCVVIPTAGGKTPIAATICKDAVTLWNGRVLILAHVKELLQQAFDKLNAIAPELMVGLYSAGLKSRDTLAPVIIAGIQSVYKKADELGSFDLILVDECFPAGTPISTPRGDVPIEDLYVGQPVHTALGVGEIECISARSTTELIQLELNNGTRIRCTPNHPFFTEQGWRKASVLEIGTNLFSKEDMRMLHTRVLSLDQERQQWKDSQLHERKFVEKATLLFNLLLEKSGESHMASWCTREGQSIFESDWTCAGNPRRERAIDRTSSATIRSSRISMDCGISDLHNIGTAESKGSERIQSGCCESDKEDSNRDRWEYPYGEKNPRCRQAPNGKFGSVRVESITYIKCKNPIAVFNLQIKGHPSYFANGALVHNCHLIPPDGEGMYQSFLADMKKINPNVRLIGLTATPYRMKSGTICAPENLLNHVCYEIGVKELINQGYICPLISKAGRHEVDTSKLHIRGGEFIANETEELMDDENLVLSACNEIASYTKDKQACLIFAAGIKHAEHIAATLRKEYNAEIECILGETSSLFREQYIEDFKSAKIKYLINVGVLTTGFDAPNIDCVALLRPTMSAGLYYQMVGRGFRLSPGKTNCLVLDFGGNIMRHGPVDSIKIKEPGKGTGEAPAKKCPECCSVIHAAYQKCPDCGYEFPPPETEKHDSSASSSGIITGQVNYMDYDVKNIAYYVHIKRYGDDDSPRTVRIEYCVGFNHYISEWVCPEHMGYVRTKFESWWRKRSHAPPPKTAEEAVLLAEDGLLAMPSKIVVKSVAGERFDRVVDYELRSIPEYIPEPGWNDEGPCEFEEADYGDEVPF